MKFTNRQLAVLALTGAAIIWGAAAPIFKWSMQEIPPYTLAFLRFFLAALIILPFAYKKISVKKTDFAKLLTLAVIGITLHIALFFVGLQMTSSINVPIIAAATPVLLIIGSLWYLQEKLKRKVLFGTIISMVGVVLIILEPLLITGPDGNVLGNILIFLSIITVVVYTILLKKFALPYPALTIVFWTFLLGSLLFIPAFITELILLQPLTSFDGKALVGILYGAIFSSAAAYFFYNYGVEYLNANEVGIFTYIEPIVTILVAMPLLGEKVNFLYIVGAVIVFAGLLIAEGRLRYHPHHHHHLLSRKHD